MKKSIDRLSPELRAALTLIDSKFSVDTVDWLASLYDKESGGFYYAASSRDNDEFWVDIESIVQAISIMQRLGMIQFIDGKWDMPDWFREKSKAYLMARQDEADGYFYDPQYREIVDRAKKERNTGFASSCLRSDLNAQPKYKTPAERVAENKKAEATSSATQKNKTDSVYDSEESFVEWLDYLVASRPNSYFWGSDIASAGSMIKGAGYEMVLAKWLRTKQNPENGTFEREFNMTAVNGVLKLVGSFTDIGEEYPCYEVFLDKVIDFTREYTPGSAAECWNPLGAMKPIIKGLGDNIPAELKAKLEGNLAELITNVANKMDVFKKSDGGYSYAKDCSSLCSNNVIVGKALPEGDVNAMALMALVYLEVYDLVNVEHPAVWRKFKDRFFDAIK